MPCLLAALLEIGQKASQWPYVVRLAHTPERPVEAMARARPLLLQELSSRVALWSLSNLDIARFL